MADNDNHGVEETTIDFTSKGPVANETSFDIPTGEGGSNKHLMDKKREELGLKPKDEAREQAEAVPQDGKSHINDFTMDFGGKKGPEVEEDSIDLKSQGSHGVEETSFDMPEPGHGGGNKRLMDMKREKLGLKPKDEAREQESHQQDGKPHVNDFTMEFGGNNRSGINEGSIDLGGGAHEPQVKETTIDFTSKGPQVANETSFDIPTHGGGNSKLMDRAREQAMQMLKDGGHNTSLPCTECEAPSAPSQATGGIVMDSGVQR